MKRKLKKGFTLVEMIIVIAIIGILATLLVPAISHYVKKAKGTAAIADAKVIKSAVESSLVMHLMEDNGDHTPAFNKQFYRNKATMPVERVGCFTNMSWSKYKNGKLIENESPSQKIDYIIASALDGAFSEKWEAGAEANPLAYNTSSNNCEKFLKDKKTNFALAVMYNNTGSVIMMQLYRKGVLVTYVDGEYIVNMNSDAHFVGRAFWNTIYKDVGRTAPAGYETTYLSNYQVTTDKNTGVEKTDSGWY